MTHLHLEVTSIRRTRSGVVATAKRLVAPEHRPLSCGALQHPGRCSVTFAEGPTVNGRSEWTFTLSGKSVKVLALPTDTPALWNLKVRRALARLP